MASSLSSTSPSAAATVTVAAASTKSARFSHSSISFPRLSPHSNNSLRFFTKVTISFHITFYLPKFIFIYTFFLIPIVSVQGCPPNHMLLCPRVKAQLNEVNILPFILHPETPLLAQTLERLTYQNNL